MRELWTSKELGEFFKCSARHAVERIACVPGFPGAVRHPTATGLSRPKWYADEVVAWSEKFQSAA